MTDADYVVDRHWLREPVQPLSDPSVGLVGGNILSKQPCSAVEPFGERIHDHRMAIEVWQPPYVITMNWAARKSALRSIDYFDEDFGRREGVDLSYRLFQTGLKIVYASNAIVYHRNEQNLTSLFHEGYLHGYYSVQAIKNSRLGYTVWLSKTQPRGLRRAFGKSETK
jgi:GT2 family glycosyltransferase